MGLADFIGRALGLLLVMSGLATAGFLSGSLETLVAVGCISGGTVFFLWGETRRA